MPTPPTTSMQRSGRRLALSLTASAPATALVDEANRAEHFGYDEIWTAEAATWDALALLSAVAARTIRIDLGVGVVNIASRSSHALATAAATLSTLSRGRFRLGLGVASPQIVERWHGGDPSSPLPQMRRAVHRVRGLLDGERLNDPPLDVRLAVSPAGRVPIYIGALGPRMLQLAAEESDGVVSVFVTPESTRQTRRFLDSRGRGDLTIVSRVFVPIPGDDEAALSGVRRLIGTYAAVPGYLAHFERQGFGRQAHAAAFAMRSRDFATVERSIDDDMVAAFAVVGSRDVQLARICELADAGSDVTALAFLPHGQHDHGDPELLRDAQHWFASEWNHRRVAGKLP